MVSPEFPEFIWCPRNSSTGDGQWSQTTSATDTIGNVTNVTANTRSGSRSGSGGATWSYPAYNSNGYTYGNEAANSYVYSRDYSWDPGTGWSASGSASNTIGDTGSCSYSDESEYADWGVDWSSEWTVTEDSNDTWSYEYTTNYELLSNGIWEISGGSGGASGSGFWEWSYNEDGLYWPSTANETIAGTFEYDSYDSTT